MDEYDLAQDVRTNSVLSLAAYRDGRYIASGCAVIIAPFLAITAKHLIDDYADKLDGNDIRHRSLEVSPLEWIKPAPLADHGEFDLMALHGTPDTEQTLWRVTTVWSRAPLDLAIIKLVPTDFGGAELYRDFQWIPQELELWPLAPDSKVISIGYVSTSIEIEGDSLVWNRSVAISEGVVKEVHLSGRDRSRAPYACFQATNQVGGSTSGGPILNEGRVCGIASSSYDFAKTDDSRESDGDPTAYHSLLYPALAIQIQYFDPANEVVQDYTVQELIREKRIVARHEELVTVSEEGSVSFTPPASSPSQN